VRFDIDELRRARNIHPAYGLDAVAPKIDAQASPARSRSRDHALDFPCWVEGGESNGQRVRRLAHRARCTESARWIRDAKCEAEAPFPMTRGLDANAVLTQGIDGTFVRRPARCFLERIGGSVEELALADRAERDGIFRMCADAEALERCAIDWRRRSDFAELAATARDGSFCRSEKAGHDDGLARDFVRLDGPPECFTRGADERGCERRLVDERRQEEAQLMRSKRDAKAATLQSILEQLPERQRCAAPEVVRDGDGDRGFRIAIARCQSDPRAVLPFAKLDAGAPDGWRGHFALSASRTTAAGERREEDPERERSSKSHGVMSSTERAAMLKT
jgi:hypothetical protein